MPLPKQIRDQIKYADKFYSEEGNTEPSTPEPSNTDVVPEEKPAAEPEPTVEPQEPETPTEAPAPAPAFGEEIDWKARAEKAEQRYQVLQGKYNKEVVEAKNNGGNDAEVTNLRNQVATLQQQLQELQSQPAPAPVQDPNAPSDEQIREDYGDELIDYMDRKAAQVAARQVQQVQQTVQKDSFATKKTLLANRLAASAINFAQVDNDPVFHDWLKKFDVNTGEQRQTRLMNSFNSGDMDATAAMYIEFVQGGNSTPSQNVNFDDHVQQPTHAPARQQTPQGNARAMYTPQMIQDFYANKRKGRYSKEEAARIEKEIFASMKR